MASDVEILRQHYETTITAQDFELNADLYPKVPLLESTGAIGDKGTFSTNCHRDLTRLLSKTSLLKPSPTSLPVKGTSLTAGGPIDTLLCIMWPHETISYIYHPYPTIWKARMYPGADTLGQLWNEMTQLGNPLMHAENVSGRTDLHTRCIPITVPGDGTPIVRHRHTAAQMKVPVVGFPAFLLVHHRYCLLIGTHTTKGLLVMSMRWLPEVIGMLH